MRALFWIIGALASAAGGAYLVGRRAKRQLSAQFLAALRQGPVLILGYEPAVASGYRQEAFQGTIGDRPFKFVGRTETSNTKWTFALIWDGASLALEWNPLTGEAEHPLKEAFDILRRRASKKDDDLSN